MNDAITIISEILLTGLISYHLVTGLLSKDKSKIWSPITAISLTYIYYVLIPYWFGTIEKYEIDESSFDGYLFHLAALLSYSFILLGFQKKSNNWFKTWTSLINEENAGNFGLIIFIIGFIGYGITRGFHMSFDSNDIENQGELLQGGFTYYILMLIDLFPVAAGLLFTKVRKSWKQWIYLIPLWFIIVDLLVAGSRFRFVYLLFVLVVSYHLYPKVRRANIPILASLAVVVFLFFSAMDYVRSYGRGIDVTKAKTLKYEDIKNGPGENYGVYWFSILCLDYFHKTGVRIYFEPLETAVLMPIPRVLYPNKPDGSYIRNLDQTIAHGGGAAYLNFVEQYYSFGWFGVIIWSLLFGWLARKFWENYQNNPKALGAVLALGIFNGFCYMYISRGYIPGSLTSFILAVCMPFWIIMLRRKMSPSHK